MPEVLSTDPAESAAQRLHRAAVAIVPSDYRHSMGRKLRPLLGLPVPRPSSRPNDQVAKPRGNRGRHPTFGGHEPGGSTARSTHDSSATFLRNAPRCGPARVLPAAQTVCECIPRDRLLPFCSTPLKSAHVRPRTSAAGGSQPFAGSPPLLRAAPRVAARAAVCLREQNATHRSETPVAASTHSAHKTILACTVRH